MKNIQNKIKKYFQNINVRHINIKNMLPAALGCVVRFWRHMVIFLAIIIVLYYPIGAFFTNKIDDNVDYFIGQKAKTGELYSIAAAAELIDREVNQKLWTANLPFFFPAVILDNMPSYQTGIITSLANFLEEFSYNSEQDESLDKAVALLKYPPNIWIIDFSKSWLPMTSTNKSYRSAMRELLFYNANVAENKRVFDKKEKALGAILLAIANDINANSLTIKRQIEKGSKKIIDLSADNVFYNNKGKNYGYYIILKALEKDFENVIKTKNIENSWNEMLENIKKASLLDPLVVINGKPDSVFMPSHLSGQGFYMMQAKYGLNQTIKLLIK